MKRTALAMLFMLAFILAGTATADEGRGYLGVTVVAGDVRHEHSDEHAREIAGVQIGDVLPDTGASEAGLAPHDKILSVDRVQVTNIEELEAALQETRPGDRVAVDVLRDGATVSLDVTLGERPARYTAKTAILLGGEGNEDRPYLGVTIENLEPQLAEYFGVDGGVLIKSVLEGTPAEEAGLEAGDVIVELEGRRLTTQGDLRKILVEEEIRPGDEVALGIQRRERFMQVYVTTGSVKDLSTTIHIDLPRMTKESLGENVEIVIEDGKVHIEEIEDGSDD